MRAWLFQDSRQKKKLGEDKCPWSVGWIAPDGRRKSKRIGTKSRAEKYRRKKEGELAAGLCDSTQRVPWSDFVKEHEEKIKPAMKPRTWAARAQSLAEFQKTIKPARVDAIRTQTIDKFIAKRRAETSKLTGKKLSAATVNRDLRHLKATLRIAHDWGYLTDVPKFRMLKERQKIPRYVTPEDFASIYEACDAASRPAGKHFPPANWWRALVTFAYMTGWRIGEILALQKDDLDLAEGTALTRAEDNKGGRDDVAPLHPVVVDHLKAIIGFDSLVFAWDGPERALWSEFHAIQAEAKISPVYGFHDLRRAFATVNAENMTGDALQRLMRHKSYTTTQRYINMAGQVKRAVEALHVPDVLRHKSG